MGIEQHDESIARLEMERDYEGIEPAELFNYWVEPRLLTLWWPTEAETDPRVGGAYRLSWPNQNWRLHGHYLEVDPGRRLGFTWQWEHEPDRQTRQVFVDFMPIPGGTRLFLTHGPYMETEQDREEKQGHLEGWTHFLGRLQATIREQTL